LATCLENQAVVTYSFIVGMTKQMFLLFNLFL
jgi:hypothetical protein